MEEAWRNLPDLALQYAARIAGAVVMLVVGWIVLRLLVGPSRRWLERSRCDPSVASFLVNSAGAPFSWRYFSPCCNSSAWKRPRS